MGKVKCQRCEKLIDADKAMYKGVYISYCEKCAKKVEKFGVPLENLL
ncbi:MAG: hypothetical protein J7J92_03400 [Candidatus Aenigmarchaeota archaeon]|nr:hypothetical protein [Candidatus Aenigmarchaeota archaeon]